VGAGNDRQGRQPPGARAGLAAIARLDGNAALRLLDAGAGGLAVPEARVRLARHGPNAVAGSPRRLPVFAFLAQFARPLPLLLLGLAAVDLATGQGISAAVIVVIVVLSSLLGFVQEHRSSRAVERLRAMVRTTARVLRPVRGGGATAVECPLEELVPGDIVLLAAGDPIPAEVRFLEAVDLFVDQSSLTGESLPSQKHAGPVDDAQADAGLANIGFMGSHVISGSARALVVATGAATSFGRVAAALAEARERTDFDRGIDRVIALLLRIMLVLAPLVLALNWASKGDWQEALLFATAVAVGLAPEMLPMIVTVNLARGALALAQRQVIVKRLGAVQSLGAIDVLCTDKTGTLTQDRVVLERHVDISGRESELVLDYAYLNSHYQTGLKNLLDTAVLQYAHVHARLKGVLGWRKIGEIPFDFRRRRMSVVLERPDGARIMICKGAVEEIVSVSASAEQDGERTAFGTAHADSLGTVVQDLNADGLRVVAIAYRVLESGESNLTDPALERALTLVGYIAFYDPPKDSAATAIAALGRHGVTVKVLSGDNAAVCQHVCGLVGIGPAAILQGVQVDALDDAELGRQAASAGIFAKLAPEQKTRVIRALQRQGRVVGFLGDGVNDGPALKAADVGISVDTGADIAKESADLILLQKSLVAVAEGVLVGRTVFGNIVKYIRMSASSNFGNMFSVLGASVLLPFLPMAPVQVLLNNLLYDCSQTALTTDRVDPGYLARPRHWEIASLRRYVLCFGPISSLFDYATFGLLWFVVGAAQAPALFQTGWFVESLLSQTLIVYVIRTSAPPTASNRPSGPLLAASVLVCAAGLWLPWSPLAPFLGFVALPAAYWSGLAAILAAYALLTELAKSWLIRRFGIG
jgi:Mg2+-importing ATPase